MSSGASRMAAAAAVLASFWDAAGPLSQAASAAPRTRTATSRNMGFTFLFWDDGRLRPGLAGGQPRVTNCRNRGVNCSGKAPPTPLRSVTGGAAPVEGRSLKGAKRGRGTRGEVGRGSGRKRRGGGGDEG